MKWRIVVNDLTQSYRIEVKRWWGWSFVMDDSGEQYRSFDSCAAASAWACTTLVQTTPKYQRWQIIDTRCRKCPPDLSARK